MSEFKVDHKQYKEEGIKPEFSRDLLSKIETIIRRYPEGKQKSALLPVLHIAQEEFGHLSVDVQNYIASLLDIQPIEVYEVATFYSQYYLEKKGKYVIEVCHTGPCAVCGGERLSEYLQEKLQIRNGETTKDNLFTLREVECLGACGSAPVMQVNTEFYENLTVEKIDHIIEDLIKEAHKSRAEGSSWAEKFF